MIIGVNEQYILVSIGNPNDENAFEIKIVDEQELNLETHIYKYDKGNVLDLGLKPEFAMTDEEKILKELEELDKVINRATEDLYILTDTIPYQSTQEVIERKEELRAELQNLNKGEM